MGTSRRRIYCAGPLFNSKEREEMEEIASSLEHAGYATFLPQRDGLEMMKCVDVLTRSGQAPDKAKSLVERAIFALDVYQVLQGCHALVANLNGRVPDEGAVAEASMAWAQGKVVIGYKNDARSVFGGTDNPLVTGLFGFQLQATIEDLIGALGSALALADDSGYVAYARQEEMESFLHLGREIWDILQDSPHEVSRVAQLLCRQEVIH